jgi:hypothetical protein
MRHVKLQSAGQVKWDMNKGFLPRTALFPPAHVSVHSRPSRKERALATDEVAENDLTTLARKARSLPRDRNDRPQAG